MAELTLDDQFPQTSRHCPVLTCSDDVVVYKVRRKGELSIWIITRVEPIGHHEREFVSARPIVAQVQLTIAPRPD